MPENEKTCCFIGHRKIDASPKLKEKLSASVENLIANEGVSVFFFGSKSKFNDLCLETVTALKEKYPLIKKVYIRAEYPVIDENYRRYLLKSYEDTYYPEKLIKAGSAVYVERNFEMIDKSDTCVFYYSESDLPQKRKSGTKIAYEYAVLKQKNVINIFDEN